MTVDHSQSYLRSLIKDLCQYPNETEWLEFKHNNANPEQIGEYISALANAAALHAKVSAYLLWGIDDQSHAILGTGFNPSNTKVGNEELESWLLRLLKPKINFRFFNIDIAGQNVVILEISNAFRHPVEFHNQKFIRVGSLKKKLKDFPEKERELWRIFDNTPFEAHVAAENLDKAAILQLLDYPAYFELLDLPLPESHHTIFATLAADQLIQRTDAGLWNLLNLGAILLAKKLDQFKSLKRKAVRVIVYRGKDRINQSVSK